MIELNKIYNEDCISLNPNEGMNRIPNKSIDMIFTDLPYGTTNRNKWDIVIPFEEMWRQYERVIKDNGVILLFSDEPFTSELICSNRKLFKQRITWDKHRGSGFLNAKRMLLKQTEDICLFYKKTPTYNPQMRQADPKEIRWGGNKGSIGSSNYGDIIETKSSDSYDPTLRYPTNLIMIPSSGKECHHNGRIHPTQKPLDLCENFIKTYSNENDIILDSCIGSGSIPIACINTNRNYIGFELDNTYFDLAEKRIEEHKSIKI